ncbi:MAG: ANTAR domain-containing protein [Oscillospiraceae bacterium]|nr:ANTAR domain-containing protein [Oscillospiraceae bacterium]
MELERRVYSVLVVSASPRVTASLTEMLPAADYDPVCVATSVSAAKRAAAEQDFDLVLINTPLPDETGVRFAIDLCANGSAAALLLVPSEQHEEICDRVSPHGVFTLAKPTSPEMAQTALAWMISARERLRRFEKKALTIEEKMEEIRLVNRAKWVLIREMQMDEQEAHRYIEKQAMDRCISKRELALELIRTTCIRMDANGVMR